MVYSATIDGKQINDWDSFHDEFARKMGFFSGYGRNGNAWIDCMRDIYTNGEYEGLTKFGLDDGDKFILKVVNVEVWKTNGLQTFNAFLDWIDPSNDDEMKFELELH